MRRRRAVIAAVLATAMTFSLSACKAEVQAPTGAVRPPRSDILAHTWATNGSVGFFIDAFGAAGDSMSLYDTAWWLEVLAEQSQTARLDPESVRAWVLPLTYGTVGSAGTTEMPPLIAMDLGLRVAKAAHIPVDRARIGEALQRYRRGSGYTPDGKAQTSWGATSIAVSMLLSLDEPIPAEVRNAIAGAWSGALSSRDLGRLFVDTLPILETAMDARLAAPTAADGDAFLARVSSVMPAVPASSRLALTRVARKIAYAAGRQWPVPKQAVCAGLDVRSTGVAFGPGSHVDPQLTADALREGCATAVAPPPWTSAGWPNPGAVLSAPQASVSGLRIAVALGVTEQYRAPLLAQIRQVWRGTWDRLSNSDRLAVEMMSRLVGSPSPAPALKAADIAAAISAGPNAPSVPLLMLAYLQGMRNVPIPATGPVHDPQGSVVTATAYEIAYRLTSSADLHHAATAVLEHLETGQGLYALGSRPGAAEQPSVFATAIAHWILGTPVPMAALRERGLCDDQPACGSGGRLATDSVLRATAAVTALIHNDAASFPIPL